MIKRIILFITCFIALPSFAFDKEEQNIISIYEKINPAIVCIDSHVLDGISCGTGCIIDKSGIILTSAHVIETGKNIVVTMSNGQDYSARILKRLGENKDIALLKIETPIEKATEDERPSIPSVKLAEFIMPSKIIMLMG